MNPTRSIPTLDEFNSMFPNEKACYEYLLQQEVFYNEMNCNECGFRMKRNDNSGWFRCNRIACKKRGSRISIRKGTFFYESSLSYVNILRLGHLWLSKAPIETTLLLTGHSEHTVCNFYKHFRQLVTSAMNEDDQIIGGPGIVVEIDETKLGKRKYNRGHLVEGVWVLVGIEKRPNGRIFLIKLENRSSDTLSNIIINHVHQGSIIETDMWRGYNNLESLGFTHYTVNHSQYFVDPISGACTNTAEGLNSGLKRRIPIRNRTTNHIEGHLGEYVWRRQNHGNLFNSFIAAIKNINYEIL